MIRSRARKANVGCYPLDKNESVGCMITMPLKRVELTGLSLNLDCPISITPHSDSRLRCVNKICIKLAFARGASAGILLKDFSNVYRMKHTRNRTLELGSHIVIPVWWGEFKVEQRFFLLFQMLLNAISYSIHDHANSDSYGYIQRLIIYIVVSVMY